MIKVRATIVGISPYSQSKVIQTPKKQGETHDDHESRTWRERLNVDEKGYVFIPPMAVKNAMVDASKFLAEKVPGKGTSTFTKHFEAGIMVIDPVNLGIKAADVAGERLFVPSDGKRGGGKRVWKTFPVMPQWRGEVEVIVMDPVLIGKEEDQAVKVREYLDHAGTYIGLGRFRPRNNGFYGRFKVEKFAVVK